VLEKKLSPLEKIGIREAELRRIWRKIGTKKARKIPRAGGKATIKRPVPKKTKRITRTKSSTPKFKLKLLTAPTVTVGIFLGNKIKNKLNQSLVSLPGLKSKVALSSASKSAQRIASKQVQVIKQKLKQLVKTAVILKSDVAVLLDVATTQAQKSALKSELKQITELIQKIRAKTKTINETKLPKLIPLPKLSWNKKAPRGKVYVVNPIVRIKGRNVELKWKTTPNLARRRIESAVDNSTTRSYSLKIVGIKKGRDVSRKQSIKFRKRVGKDTRVQFNVEKTRFLIDTSGEKRGLKIARLIKKRANPKPKKAKRKVTRVRSKPKRKARKPTKRKAKRITPKKANKSHKKTTKRTKK